MWSTPQKNPFAPQPEAPQKEEPAPPSYVSEGLGMDTRTRILANLSVLLSFLQSFHKLQPRLPGWAARGGQRYCYFLRLQEQHPSERLIPTADILFAQICHLSYTKPYGKDLPPALVPHNVLAPPYSFSHQVKRTASLWEQLFGFPYLPAGFSTRDVPRHCFIECLGPEIPSDELPRGYPISITAKDMQSAFEWMRVACRAWQKASKSFGPDQVVQQITAVGLYEKYLALVKDLQKEAGYPVGYIELVWLAHLCSPHLCRTETKAFLQCDHPHGEQPSNYEEQIRTFTSSFHKVNNVLLDVASSLPAQKPPPADDKPPQDAQGLTVTTQHAVVAVHRGVHCDSCKSHPLMGTRYRCSHPSCKDFDLCSICYAGRTHPADHYFYVIPTPPIPLEDK